MQHRSPKLILVTAEFNFGFEAVPPTPTKIFRGYLVGILALETPKMVNYDMATKMSYTQWGFEEAFPLTFLKWRLGLFLQSQPQRGQKMAVQTDPFSIEAFNSNCLHASLDGPTKINKVVCRQKSECKRPCRRQIGFNSMSYEIRLPENER